MKKTNTNWKAVEDIITRYKDREIDPKQHFRFGKLECYELAKVRTTRHAKYNINYHFVWIPKTRSKVLQERVARIVRNVAIQICKKYSWTPLAMEIMPEHIHLFLSAPPKWAPADIIKRIKGNVSQGKFACCSKSSRNIGRRNCGQTHITAELLDMFLKSK